MKLFKVILICVVFIFSYSCKKNQSDLNQITSSKVTCHAIEEVTKKYLEKYGSHFSPSSYAEKSLEVLSNVPEEYLEYIFTTHKAKVDVKGLNGFYYYNSKLVCGITHLSVTGNTRTVGNIESTVECLPHEFGHDTFSYLAAQHKDFVKDLTTLSKKINASYKKRASEYLNSYQDNSYWRIDEVLAELFDTWYCSEAARKTLADAEVGIPEAAAFAKKYFLPPVQSNDPIQEYDDTKEETAQQNTTDSDTVTTDQTEQTTQTATTQTNQTYQNTQNYQTTRRVGWFRMGGRRR